MNELEALSKLLGKTIILEEDMREELLDSYLYIPTWNAYICKEKY